MNTHTVSLRFTTSAEMTRAVFQLMSRMLKPLNLDQSQRDRLMLAIGVHTGKEYLSGS